MVDDVAGKREARPEAHAGPGPAHLDFSPIFVHNIVLNLLGRANRLHVGIVARFSKAYTRPLSSSTQALFCGTCWVVSVTVVCTLSSDRSAPQPHDTWHSRDGPANMDEALMFRYVITETVHVELRSGRVQAPAGSDIKPAHKAAKVHSNSGHHVVAQADIISKT